MLDSSHIISNLLNLSNIDCHESAKPSQGFADNGSQFKEFNINVARGTSGIILGNETKNTSQIQIQICSHDGLIYCYIRSMKNQDVFLAFQVSLKPQQMFCSPRSFLLTWRKNCSELSFAWCCNILILVRGIGMPIFNSNPFQGGYPYSNAFQIPITIM